ncbi:MAG: hypothetical protein GX933_02120 [Chloroflexi bacterium]|nr:hypothetical protein [Chloroflexota bacterium]
MTAWETLRSTTLQLLGDENGRRFSDGMLRVGLQFALEVYGLYFPRTTELEVEAEFVSAESAFVSLTLPGGVILNSVALRCETAVVWQDIDCIAQQQGERYCFRSKSFVGLAAPLSLRLRLQLPHQLEGLDGATATSLPAHHLQILCEGTAGFALQARAAAIAEVNGKRPQDFPRLERQAKALLKSFQARLQNDASASLERISQPFPIAGFKI